MSSATKRHLQGGVSPPWAPGSCSLCPGSSSCGHDSTLGTDAVQADQSLVHTQFITESLKLKTNNTIHI